MPQALWRLSPNEKGLNLFESWMLIFSSNSTFLSSKFYLCTILNITFSVKFLSLKWSSSCSYKSSEFNEIDLWRSIYELFSVSILSLTLFLSFLANISVLYSTVSVVAFSKLETLILTNSFLTLKMGCESCLVSFRALAFVCYIMGESEKFTCFFYFALFWTIEILAFAYRTLGSGEALLLLISSLF